MTTQFVEMYHPLIASTITTPARVPAQSVDDHMAQGWLLVDPEVEPPAPVTPYYSTAAADSRFVRTTLLDTAMTAVAADADSTFAVEQRAASDAHLAANGLRRTATKVNPDHASGLRAPAPLTIPTYDGSGQATHPDVFYAPSGWGSDSNGKAWKYWMVMTPYPGSDASKENPSIVVSDDGDAWVNPPGLTNPIDPEPLLGFNSDTDMALGPDNRLYVFWRENSGGNEYIYYASSADGISWTSQTLALSTPQTTETLLSPTVLFDGERWCVWTVDIRMTPYRIRRRTAPAITGPWSSSTLATCPAPTGPLGAALDIWHLDVVRAGSEYHAIINTVAAGSSGSAPRFLYFATSPDGLAWTVGANPAINTAAAIGGVNGVWDQSPYRACLVPLDDGRSGYRCFYSAADYSSGTVWRIGVTDISLDAHSQARSRDRVGEAGHFAHGLLDPDSINLLCAFKGLPPYLLGDSFDRADNPSSLGTSDSGHAWTAALGTWGVIGKQAYISAAANSRAIFDAGVADVVMEGTVGGGAANDDWWMLFRYSDNTNYLRVGGTLTFTTKLQTVVAGTATIVAQANQTVNVGDRLRAVCQGSRILIFRRTVSDPRWRLLLSQTVTHNATATVVGLQASQTTARFDNLTVRSLVNGG